MGMHVNSALPDPAQIKEELPLAPELKALKAKRDAEIRDVFTGVSNKFLVIVGPCSADNEDAVCEYTSRLGELAREVSDKLLIIPRIYTNKPRTTGEGYKGMLHQPNPRPRPICLLAFRRFATCIFAPWPKADSRRPMRCCIRKIAAISMMF